MALVRVGAKHQVVIPKDVFEKLGLAPGDYVEVSARKNEAVIRRKKVVDDFPITDEPISPKRQAALRRALKEMAAGNVVGPFRTDEEITAFHKSLMKRR